MITIEGKCGIKSTVICDSITEDGIRLRTYETEYPRIIHSELMTHRMFSRNAASSRAIPFAKMQQQITGRPVRFGANQAGMQDSGEHSALIKGRPLNDMILPFYEPEEAWDMAKADAVFWSQAFHDAGYHKQICNRLTEPFSMMKTVLSGTELENFFWLRNHDAADPTIAELARCMFEARELSIPRLLKPGQWHTPYVDYDDELQSYYITNDLGIPTYLSVEDAIKVSAARCAAVSFRNSDYTLEKCLEVYDRLVGADRKHASAFGHQASPMQRSSAWPYHTLINEASNSSTWEPGISHADRDGQLWSSMLRGWVQQRKLIPGENYTGA